MFKQEQINEKGVETIIGPSVKVKGNFQTKGSVQIDGQLEGTFKIEEDLIVGENAKITANIQAKKISVAGEIKGNINASESLTLSEKSRIEGDIETDVLSAAPGAIINGKIKMGQKQNLEKIKEDNIENKPE
ncbi:polymer-forming cytoskeletal protein [Candidatus Parcubacteria bacterium]|nr:polymer-forming cytoskeletal protein [Candidatus Parcubacteria bacterium]